MTIFLRQLKLLLTIFAVRSHCWPLVSIFTITMLFFWKSSPTCWPPAYPSAWGYLVLLFHEILIHQIILLAKVPLKCSKTLLCVIRFSEFCITCKSAEVCNQIIKEGLKYYWLHSWPLRWTSSAQTPAGFDAVDHNPLSPAAESTSLLPSLACIWTDSLHDVVGNCQKALIQWRPINPNISTQGAISLVKHDFPFVYPCWLLQITSASFFA